MSSDSHKIDMKLDLVVVDKATQDFCNSVNIYLLKVNNRNHRTSWEIYLTIKTTERCQWCRSSVSIVNFEPVFASWERYSTNINLLKTNRIYLSHLILIKNQLSIFYIMRKVTMNRLIGKGTKPQHTFTCWKSTLVTLENSVNYVQN